MRRERKSWNGIAFDHSAAAGRFRDGDKFLTNAQAEAELLL